MRDLPLGNENSDVASMTPGRADAFRPVPGHLQEREPVMLLPMDALRDLGGSGGHRGRLTPPPRVHAS